MSEDLHKYNDFFREKLDNHESSVPEDLFERLMSDRGMREQLGDLESAVPENLFAQLMRDREGSDEMPADAPLRERLLEHEEAVLKPTFEDIIEERERRRRALLWRSATILALLLMSYFMFIKNEILIEPKSEKPINKENINKENQDKSVVINNKNEEKKDLDMSESKDNSLNENNQIYTEGGVFIENKKLKNSDSEKTNQTITRNNQAKNTSATTAALSNPTTNLTAVSKAAHSTNTVSNSTNYSTEPTASQQTIIPTTTIPTTLEAVVSEPINNTEGAVFDVKRQVFDFENLSIFKVKNIALPTRDLKNPCTNPDPNGGCPSFGKRNRRHGGGEKTFFVDAFGAPEYAFRRLSQNLPESGAYLNARDTVEKPWYALSAGVRASVVFESGLAFRTGLIYTQTNEKAVFDSLGIGKKDIHITDTYVPRLGGGVDTIRVTTTTYQRGIFRTTYYNRYRSIDIPLQLGFEFPLNDNWSFSVNGGANFNISSWRKADILNTNLKHEEISNGLGETNPVFRNSLGLSLFGSVAAYRQISSDLQLVIEPSVRHYLQPMTRSDYALKQAYTNAGLIVGLRFHL